ncbi:hypothetical protein [Paraburkholderia diazotrophica]|uniref:hypothetical protein n=1 Tax=Paraburkholderia diazotrophica TaxID=667676 RepID=UPI00316FE206
MTTYAIVEDGKVTNTVDWDGKTDWQPPGGVTAVALPNGSSATIGYAYDGSIFTPPITTVPTPTLAQKAQAALAVGLSIASTGTPALNGTYACDALSQSDIIAIETSLSAGKGFPGGATTFGYPDTAGVMHSFSAADFTNLAAAVRDFVYGCRAVISGASTTLPAATATIA